VSSGVIYYGTGLSTSSALSVGLPFDVLGVVLTAERLRRHMGLGHIYHHVADTHALSNDFANPCEVAERSESVIDIMRRVKDHLSLDHLTVMLSSSFDKSEEYSRIVEQVDKKKGDYVRRELADMLWYRKYRNVAIKVGWILQSGPVREGFDERLYDNEFRRQFGDSLSFVYLKAGRTFDQRRPKASPYISIPNESRILLAPGEKVEAKIDAARKKWPDKTLGGALSHLNAVVRLYDQLSPCPTERGPLHERVQSIIDRIFDEANVT
jgi:hypothetical protein